MYQAIRQSQAPEEQCPIHKKGKIMSICVAPECFNYRELCDQCIKEDAHHVKMHKRKQNAFLEVQESMDNLYKGLKALRKKILHTMDTKMNNQHGLKQIEDKLSQIKKLLNNKIDNFHTELKRIYEVNVKEKLEELFFMVEKSEQFLDRERTQLLKSERLKPFFVNDLRHDLKYYQSYYQQILEKNVRRFKTGLEHDKVLKLMVSFEQNLSEIFKFQTVNHNNLHLNQIMYTNNKGHFLYKLNSSSRGVSEQELDFISKQEHLVGAVPLVYYEPKDVYYLIGDGSRESNKIRKMCIDTKEFKVLEVKMETKRTNFAVCVFNQEVFIVGGENSKQGCLSKCQKFVPSEGKMYVVSSLNQRSAKHALIPYKDKFILKFGGTDVISSILEGYEERYEVLSPEIYCAETEDWRILTFEGSGSRITDAKHRIDFGLWPGIFDPEDHGRIIILSGDLMRNKPKKRYDVSLEQHQGEIKEMRIATFGLNLGPKQRIFPHCSLITEQRNLEFIILDGGGGRLFYPASLPILPREDKREPLSL